MANGVILIKDANGTNQQIAVDVSAGINTPQHVVVSSVLPSGAATEVTLANIYTALGGGGGGLALESTQENVLVALQGTLAVSALSLPLPTGAATAAKQPTLGTAGAAATTVITVQGIASMTPIAISASALPIPTGAATEAKQDTGNTSLATLAGIVTSARAAVNPISGQVGVTGNTGTVDATTQRVVLATNVALPAGSAIIGKVGIDQTTPGTTNLVQVGGSLPAGSAIIGNFRIDQTTPGTTNGVQANASSALIGDVSIQPRSTGTALSTFMASSADGSTALTNTAQAIKASAGKLYGYYIYNPNATAQFVLIYNTAAASVVVGTTNPLLMYTIPALSAANVMTDIGITFSNAGWSCAATSTAGGNGAPGTAFDAVFYYS